MVQVFKTELADIVSFDEETTDSFAHNNGVKNKKKVEKNRLRNRLVFNYQF